MLVWLFLGPALGAVLGLLLGLWITRPRPTAERRREYWDAMYGATPPLSDESFDEWARRNDV